MMTVMMMMMMMMMMTSLPHYHRILDQGTSPPLALAAPQHRSVLWPVASTKAQCLHFSLSQSQTVLPLMRFIDTSFSRNGVEVEKDVFARTI